MLSWLRAVRVFVHTRPTDMRRSFDCLAQMAQELLDQDPLSGHLFVFINRTGDRMKVLFWDHSGYVLFYKRLSKGRFSWWPQNPSGTTQALEAHQLGVLLSGGDPAAAEGVPPWRRVDVRL